MFTRRFLLGLFGAGALAPGARGGVRSKRERKAVLLLRSRVNGELYYDAAVAIGDLGVGSPVALRREPDNRHDRRAVEVLDDAGRKLGYLARIDNPAVARMMDAGERFRASVTRVDPRTLDIRLDVHWLPA